MSLVWESLVFAIISFGILYFLLNKYAFGPLFAVMEKRRQMVTEQIQSAEKNRMESEKLLAEQQEAMQTAKQEAYDIIEQARVTSARQSEEMVRQAKEEASRLKNDAVKDIENEKQKAIASLRSQVSAMSVMIASKIIEKQVDEKSQEELITHYLKDVENTSTNGAGGRS